MRTSSRRRLLGAGVALAAAAAGLAGLAGTASAGARPQSAAAGSELIVNTGTPPSSLDPAFTCNLEDLSLISDLYVTLVKYDVKGEGLNQAVDPSKIVGYAAKDYSVSADGLTYTFNLREGATFASGAPIDAEAVKYSFERATTVGSKGCGGYFAHAGQMPDGVVKEVTVASPTQVVVTLTRPEPLYLRALTVPANGLLDRTVIDANGGMEKSADFLATNSASGGPYTIESYEPGSKLVLAANPKFFGDAPKHAKVTVNFITAPETLLLEARNGNADVTIGLPAASVNDLKADACCDVVSTPLPAWQAVYLPTKAAPFDNADFRKALALAVPYQDIVDKVAFGNGTAFFGPYPPAFPAYNEANGAPLATSMDEAKAALAKSGVTGSTNLEIVIREGVAEQEQLATVLQGAWSDLGVNVTITKSAASAYSEAITKPDKTFAMIRFDGPAVPDPAWLLDYDLPCGSPYNVSNYCNADAEALLKQAHAETDDAKRQAIWDQIATLWRADTPRIPIYAVNQTVVLKKGMTSFVSSIDEYWFHTWG